MDEFTVGGDEKMVLMPIVCYQGVTSWGKSGIRKRCWVDWIVTPSFTFVDDLTEAYRNKAVFST